ncbi:type ISP restriction/modification enzyme [Kribbella sp. NPDC051620]|uniref:type ISP restriction/modification enzyme n=1 Tax=Kribbella sp. NPDC051620 TaxID=3364120 RepID=UPI00378DDEFC
MTKKLRTGQGSREDHLRGPFERMLAAAASSLGLKLTAIGETRLPDLSIRPDYAVDVANARVGYVELKKPGHGVPGTWGRPGKHDLEQWEKFQLLPNVLYSDGEQFARYSFGKLQGKVARLAPGLDHAGDKLHAVSTDFARVLTDFLLWEPERPRTLDELVRLVANLCRLLRDDVAAELRREQLGQSSGHTFSRLATDWRGILFPNLSDAEFADQYSQTVTFALLLARVESVDFDGQSIGEIARLLGKKHSLMGRALTVLTDLPEEDHSVALTTMIRVLSVVDWSDFPDDSYAMLYENFLAKYDPALRRKSGVYYTPASLVTFMTRFVDDVLRTRLGRSMGFAEKDVIVVDPAMGTGSFLAEVIDTVATTIAADEGLGAVAPHLRELSNRLIGFENQAAPYAVAELRIHSLLKKRHRAEVPAHERRFLADTLDDPNVQLLPLGHMYEAIERSRYGANQVKREEPVMVVIGNPPYVDKVKGTAKWIETPGSTVDAPSLSAFRRPGNGRLEYVLSNKYVYFWRWATWKAFDAHPAHPAGVVAFVCSAGFTTGPGFAGMREYFRRTADEGWIIDLTPEGHQPPMETRFFRGNQQPICVAVFIRQGGPRPDEPARIRRIEVAGTVAQKASRLATLTSADEAWNDCLDDWGDPFKVAGRDAWSAMPAMPDLFPWTSPGVKPNRTWVYAPDPATLVKRWNTIITADPDLKPTLFQEGGDANLQRVTQPLPGFPSRTRPFVEEGGPPPQPTQIGFRAFDRQWLIPDHRLIARPRAPLWQASSREQVFIVEQHAHRITAGPALLFSALIPDMHFFMGHHGGRVFPIYRDGSPGSPNVAPGLVNLLSERFGYAVTPQDVVGYLAGTLAHSGYTDRFGSDLDTPGVRVPFTADRRLWRDVLEAGREVVWLHTYGERFVDRAAGRPSGPPRMKVGRPQVLVSIADTAGGMPVRMVYNESDCVLRIGAGAIGPVSPRIMAYQISGMFVVRHWFGYRSKNPAGNRKSALDDIVARTWTPGMTTELLDLLNVVGRCVELESVQQDLLGRVMDGPLITVADLTRAGVLPVPDAARKPPKIGRGDDLFSV